MTGLDERDRAGMYPRPFYRVGLAVPPMTRRVFLRVAGLLAVVLAAGGYAVYVFLPIAGATAVVAAAAAWLVWRFVRRRNARGR